MLEPAIKYKELIPQLYHQTWFDDKYKYWNNTVYHRIKKIEEETWNVHQFVSVSNGFVIGYIEYYISRATNNVYDLNILNFTDDKITFGADVMKALKNIFEKYKFNKLSFEVVIGNPIESQYDKLIKRYGGKIIGIKENDVRLIDNEYYDVKLYEILYKDYIQNKKLHRK